MAYRFWSLQAKLVPTSMPVPSPFSLWDLWGGAEEVGGRLEKSQDEVGPGRNQSLRRPQGLEQLRDRNTMLSSWLVRQAGPLGARGTRVLWSRSILSHRVMLTPERKVMEKSGK